MAVQRVDVPQQPSSLDLSPEVRQGVMRRARQLCLQAEPHTHELPCSTHLGEADRQYFGLHIQGG